MSAGKNDDEGYRGYDVIPSLMDLLTEATDQLGKARGIKKTHKDIGSHLSKSERQVRRYFEDDSGLTLAELDALVAAVAIESNGDRMDFWHGAIQSVDTNLKRIGHDPRQEPGEAARLAPPEESDPDSGQSGD